MDDKEDKSTNSTNLLIIAGIIVIIVIIIGLIATGTVNINGITDNSTSKNPSKISGQVLNYSTGPDSEIMEVQIKLKGSNIPEGQENYFKIVGNLNGTPADELWFTFPEGSKLTNGMIITITNPNDLGIYDSFTVYLYNKPLFDENSTVIIPAPEPIFNTTIKNTAYNK
ncbi:MAG: hypothetical protein Q8R66_04090 [Methanobacteriaceae archaeon]|nr:hypothetical protein [Methanobacteriaceae archaeon]